MAPRVYVETSVIGYLTARPSRDLVMAAHQEVTHEWWRSRRAAFALFYSEVVRDEASMGDSQAAAQAFDLANALVDATALPVKARVDALHIAIAACECMDWHALSCAPR